MADQINVLIVSSIDPLSALAEEITGLDPRLSVQDGTAGFLAELRSQGRTGPWVERLAAVVAQGRPVGSPPKTLDSLLAEAEIVYAMVLIPDHIRERAPKLRWIHIGNAGIEAFLSVGLVSPIGSGASTARADMMPKADIMLTNSRGVHAIGIAEHTMALIFALAKGIPRLLANQRSRRWERFVTPELRHKVLGIVGLGAIGSEIAGLARGLGMRVIATKRSAVIRESDASGINELFPPADLRTMLAQSDFVVIAAPLTAETKDMVSEPELKSMKTTAYLINVARGEIVNQPALIKALAQGWIAGAGLDAFAIEPLPQESELWELPNVILSPHMSGLTERRSDRLMGLFRENLRRYLAGRELLNLIDIDKGY